jgi:transposase
MARQRKKHTEEFKRDAVRLMRNRGDRTVVEVAESLGIGPSLLHRWAQKLEEAAVARHNDRGETLEEENRRLRKEVDRLRMEKAILKKAAAFFARDDE